MPSSSETYILLCVLGIVLASLPVAMILRRRAPVIAGAIAAPGSPWPAPPPLPEWYDPYAPPATPLSGDRAAVVPGRRTAFGRADAWFAFSLVLMVSVLMGPVSSVLMGVGDKTTDAVKIEYTSSLFVTQLIFQAGIVTLVLVWLGAVRKFNPLQVFGLRERSPLMTLGLAVVGLVVAYAALLLVSAALTPLIEQVSGIKLRQQGLVESAPDIKDPATRVLMAITLCVGAPLMEEFIFRGMIYGVASRYFHPVYANVASSLLFGVIHNNLLSLIPLTILGVCLAEAYRRSRSLAVPVLMHAAFNGISFLLLMYGPPELHQK